MVENIFIELTKRMLNEKHKDYDENRMVKLGFSPVIDESKSSVLVLGLNPAGNEEDAEREAKIPTFIHYIPFDDNEYSYNLKNRMTNPQFSKGLFNVMESVFGKNNFIWDWCNLENPVKTFDDELARLYGCGFSEYEKNTINGFINDRKDAKYQVFIGDLFYYHQTSEFAKLIKYSYDASKNNLYSEVISMLDEHLKCFNGNDLKFVYVNSALASHYIRYALENKGYKMKHYGGFEYKKIPIILGAAFSGRAAMDVYSRERVIHQLKNLL